MKPRKASCGGRPVPGFGRPPFTLCLLHRGAVSALRDGQAPGMEGEKEMIVTTTPAIEGKQIEEYLGVVCGEVISGIDFVRDFAASLTNFLGGRSKGYEEEVAQARENAMQEMQQRAGNLGADAIVGVDIDFEVIGGDQSNMLMVTVSGTAVRLRD